ncbi:MAG: hypothetical protein JRI68_26875 [Deltaproteobacteria bacterium]|nr:hypothetical protein [Deltaproteobacteria bacterium]
MTNLRSLSGMVLAAMLCTSVVWTGCKKESAEETAAGDPCDDYVAAMEKCVAKIPEEQRAPMKKQLEAQQDALAKAGTAAREQMTGGCRTGLAALKADSRCE